MFRKISSLCVLSMALMTLAGCVIDGSESGANATVETQTETFIDPDAKKESALGLIFGMPQIDDRLDYEGGDREDWRYIIVSEQGVMSVTINVDQPKNIEGGWNIIDSEGRILHRESFSTSAGFYEFRDFPVKQGVYYFQVFATSGKSIYTIATSYRPAAPVIVAAPTEPEIDEEDEEEEEVREEPRHKRHHHSHSSSKVQSNDTPKPKPVAKSEPKKKGVKGFISLITPKPDGSAEVTIRNAGKDKGIEKGSVGHISGTDMDIEMSVCFATSCRAIISADDNPKSLKKGADVVF